MQRRTFLAASTAMAAATTLPITALAQTGSQPADPALDRPLRRRPALRQGEGRRLQAGAGGGDGRGTGRDRRHRQQPAPRRPSRTPSRRWSAPAGRCDRVQTDLRRLERHPVDAGDASAVENEMEPKLAGLQRRDHAERRSSSPASRRSTRRRDTAKPDARAAAADLGATGTTSCAPAPSSTPRPRRASPRSTSELAEPLHQVQPEPAGRRGRLRSST